MLDIGWWPNKPAKECHNTILLIVFLILDHCSGTLNITYLLFFKHMTIIKFVTSESTFSLGYHRQFFKALADG
jgi:hypothetical protein